MRRGFYGVLWSISLSVCATPCVTVGTEKILNLLTPSPSSKNEKEWALEASYRLSLRDNLKLALLSSALVMWYSEMKTEGEKFHFETEALSPDYRVLWKPPYPLLWAVLQIELPEKDEGICMVVQKKNINPARFVLHTWRTKDHKVRYQEQPITDFDENQLHAGNVRQLMLRWATQKTEGTL